jgi:hypothetical protein
VLALIAALLFLIALLVELIINFSLDKALMTAGLILLALHLGGLGPRTWRPV